MKFSQVIIPMAAIIFLGCWITKAEVSAGVIDNNKSGNLSTLTSDTHLAQSKDWFEDTDDDGLYNLAEVKVGLDPTALDMSELEVITVSKSPKNGTDETNRLQDALDQGSGKIVVLPQDSEFKVNGLKVHDNTTLIAYGSKIYNDTEHRTLLNIGNGVKIYGLELQGAGNIEVNRQGVGINIQGTNAADYKKNIIIEDSFIHDIGFYGIMAQFTENVAVTNTRFQDIGYAGVGGLSVNNFHIDKSHIKGIYPGENNNAYGVFFSRKGSTSSLEDYPRSKHSSVTNSVIEDVPWEGLDTHGGENITFNNNTIRNTVVGIAFVNATGDGRVEQFEAQHSQAKGNRIEGIGKGYGIVISGLPTAYSSGIIEDNYLINTGQQGNNISGAIQASYTSGLIIDGNTLINSFANGINLYHNNKGFSVTKNTIQDVQDSIYAIPSGIAVRSYYNEGTISENTLIKKDTSLNTYVSARGIHISSNDNVKVVIGPNSNNFTMPIAGDERTYEIKKTTGFSDLGNAQWAENQINFLSEKGIVNGYTNGKFGPYDKITRGQATIMLVKALYPNEKVNKSANFSDVQSSDYYFDSVSIAQEKEIISGHEDGTFRGYNYITRAQIAVIIDKAFNVQKGSLRVSFNDVTNGQWHTESINNLASQQILAGYQDGSFKPYNNVTRAQFSVILANALGY
ncbi:S-layer homology domain-containing protein [Virgibacillus sediminis]|uniref:S-layer homology domain-containing protein n=1 Tax=Virgibacillus sediminis TaxID=202260 RepID=A0ABV7A4G4_9BACI